MTTNEVQTLFDLFLAKNNGKYISLLSPGKQCFDLVCLWTDLLGIPHYPGNPSPFPYANAYQIYTDYKVWHAAYFDRIANTPDYVPQKGDILVWDSKLNGGIGHTAVATGEGDTNWFKSFDQNWSIGAPAQIIKHDYKFLLGCLRLKVTQPSTQQPMARTPEDAKYIAQLEKAVNEKDAKIKELENENLMLSDSIDIERSNHQAELADKDKQCKIKINEIKAIPPKIEEKIVTVPYEWRNPLLRSIVPIVQDWDSKQPLPVSGDVRK